MIFLNSLIFSTMSFVASAAPLNYVCQVDELPVSDSSLQKSIELGGPSGRVVGEVEIKQKKFVVQLELYFKNIQIHVVDENSDIFLTATATDTSPSLVLVARDIVKVTCLRK